MILSWQRFDLGFRLVLCSGPMLVCVFSLAEFPETSGWVLLASGAAAGVSAVALPGVAIVVAGRNVWLVCSLFCAIRVRLSAVSGVERTTVLPFEDFGGWGIKGSPRRNGLLLAASGDLAIRIRHEDGRVFLATTTEPDLVVREIRRLIDRAPLLSPPIPGRETP